MKKNTKQKNKGNTNAGSTAAAESIIESMRCPVCTDVLLSPIYQCERGHNICSVCVDEVHECPLCKGDYGDTRNYFAEDLVDSMSLPCKYEEYGCKTVVLGSQLREHQENCESQPYRCPELACPDLIGQSEMPKHLDKHGFQLITGEGHLATFDIQDKHFDSKTEFNPWRIQAFGREFYTIVTRQKDKFWYFWSWVLALPKEAKKFSNEIIVKSSDKQVLYRGSVHSLRTQPDEIIKGANALVISDQLVKAMRENGKIICSVRFIEGKNWDKDAKASKKPFLQAKKESKKAVVYKVKSKIKTAPSVSVKKSLPSTSSATTSTSSKSSKTKVSLLGTTGIQNASALSKLLAPFKTKVSPRRSPVSKKPSVSDVAKKPSVSDVAKKPSVSDAEHRFVMKIRESLRCPGCRDTISPPIFLCSVGHAVCDACRLKHASNCPLCRSPMTGTRNFFAEELLYKTVQKCRFHISGCDVCLPAVQIRLHEETCDFAPLECPFSTCRKVFDPKDLLGHMKTHDIPLVKNELNSVVPFPKSTSAAVCAIPGILMMQGLAFYPLVIRESNGLWSFWVASSDAEKFVYELRIKKQSQMIVYQGRVQSLRYSPNQIVLKGEGFHTTDKAIKNFKTQNQLDYSIKVAPIRGFAKSGVNFITTLCSSPKIGPKVAATKTELFANKRTSKSLSRDEDEDIFFPSTQSNQSYQRLFALDNENDDSDTGSSRSSHSLKKSKSGNSVSSLGKDSGESDSFVTPTKSETNLTLNVDEFDEDEIGGAVGGHRVQKVRKTNKNLGATPLKKKSALKLKEKDSSNDVGLKESTSLKKVEFNLDLTTTETYTRDFSEDQNKVNNNWVGDDQAETGENSTELDEPPIIQQTKSKPKDEIYSHSCTDLGNCGNRKKMKSKIQRVSTLGSIREEDENGGAETAEQNMEVVLGRFPKDTHSDINVRPLVGILGLSKGVLKSGDEKIEKRVRSQENVNIGGNTSMSMGEFVGPIEVIIKSEDKTASVSLTNVHKNLDSTISAHCITSNGNMVSNIDIQIPLAESESMEVVEETEVACQVGSSLSRMAKSEVEAKEIALYSKSLPSIDLDQSFGAVSASTSATYQSVKKILSGIIPQGASTNQSSSTSSTKTTCLVGKDVAKSK